MTREPLQCRRTPPRLAAPIVRLSQPALFVQQRILKPPKRNRPARATATGKTVDAPSVRTNFRRSSMVHAPHITPLFGKNRPKRGKDGEEYDFPLIDTAQIPPGHAANLHTIPHRGNKKPPSGLLSIGEAYPVPLPQSQASPPVINGHRRGLKIKIASPRPRGEGGPQGGG